MDIGGQDTKVIHVGADGGVDDFAMNEKCAAGTGRFLEVVLARLEVMVTSVNPSLPLLNVRRLLASAIHLITHQERLPDGSRCQQPEFPARIFRASASSTIRGCSFCSTNEFTKSTVAGFCPSPQPTNKEL